MINAFSIHTPLVRISLSYTGEYSSSNVLCINYNNSSAAEPPYRLQGCPNEFLNTAQNTSGISGNGSTGSSENDTKSGESHSSALGIDVEISKSDTSSSETVPNTNVADQISSSDIESSCDTIQQNVIQKSNGISNDKTTDKQVDQEGNNCADSCDSDEVQKAEKSPQIKNENLDSLGNTDSEENKMETTVMGNNKSEVRISQFN